MTDLRNEYLKWGIDMQPNPLKNNNPEVYKLVTNDLEERYRIGLERYGVALQPFNGRDALIDAYEEAIDLVFYLRQAIYERDNKKEDVKVQSDY